MNTEIRFVRLSGHEVCIIFRYGKEESMEKLYKKAKSISSSSFKSAVAEKDPFKKVKLTFEKPSEAKSMFTYLYNLLMPV